MIFRPDLVEKILAGEKTETRRWLDPNRECRYRAGRSYAVQPGRGRRAVGRIRIKEVYPSTLWHVDEDVARREGFGSREAFEKYWRGLHGWWNPGVWVWVIRFELEVA